MISINLNLVWTIINLIILYLLLRQFLMEPVMNIMEKRKQLIEDGFKNAQEMQDNALQMKQEYEAALDGAKQESIQIVENARKNAKAEYDRIVAEADDQAGNIIESAKETVRVEREKTMKELQSEIAGLAVASARKLVGQSATGQEPYDQFFEEMTDKAEEGDKHEER